MDNSDNSEQWKVKDYTLEKSAIFFSACDVS